MRQSIATMRGTMLLAALLCLSTATSSTAQEQTVGLFQNDEGAHIGFTLFAPMLGATTYLIDNDGLLVHQWEHVPANQGGGIPTVYLLENGHLLRGNGGRIEEYDWDGNLVWSFVSNDDQRRLHHDIEPLPNGHVLALAYETIPAAEAIAAGRDPGLLSDGELWPDTVLEIEPTGAQGGNIVWEWRVWDHLIQDIDSTQANVGVVADHPELVDVNFASNGDDDWTHLNGIDYTEALDQIVVSSFFLSEIWVIDHSTPTEEAAGHTEGNRGKGGDLLYRWGNPQAYRAGTTDDQVLYGVHDPRWIESGVPGAGNVLVFNNGNRRPEGAFSSVEEITPPVDVDGNYDLTPGVVPVEVAWSYTAENPTDFFSNFISGAQRLPNGNTLVCIGASGTFFEIDADEEVVWWYVNPVTRNGPLTQGDPIPQTQQGNRPPMSENIVFKTQRYAPDYPGLAGRDLTPGAPIELAPTNTAVEEPADDVPRTFSLSPNYPNPFNPATTIGYTLGQASHVSLKVYDGLGREVASLVEEFQPQGPYSRSFDASDLTSGVYFVKLTAGDFVQSIPVVLMK